jgi:hypothetical protein
MSMRFDRASGCGSPKLSDLSLLQKELEHFRPFDHPKREYRSENDHVNSIHRNEAERVEEGQELIIRTKSTRFWWGSRHPHSGQRYSAKPAQQPVVSLGQLAARQRIRNRGRGADGRSRGSLWVSATAARAHQQPLWRRSAGIPDGSRRMRSWFTDHVLRVLSALLRGSSKL